MEKGHQVYCQGAEWLLRVPLAEIVWTSVFTGSFCVHMDISEIQTCSRRLDVSILSILPVGFGLASINTIENGRSTNAASYLELTRGAVFVPRGH